MRGRASLIRGSAIGTPVRQVTRFARVSRTSAGRRSTALARLRDIEALTDAGLAHLGVEEMLVELLDRVRDVLAADTAAVLLLDEPNAQLVATAARGIEEEVYQGVRVPLGRGFAGRVAAAKRPVRIDDLEDADIVNPLLREKGIRSLAGVPLLAGGRLLGVLHVGRTVPRPYTDADVELLRMAADRVALATHAMLTETERTASVVLQRSLLPPQLADVPGLEAAVRYIAGGLGDVGGDWYDMFTVPSGRVWITVGDVVGRGLRAAVVMGRLRSSLRAHCLAHQRRPDAVLDLVDRHLQHFEPGEMATAVVAVIEPAFDRVLLSTAGHPAPVLAAPERPGTYVDVPADPPLGVAHPAPRRVTTIDLPPGGVLCFYTDGLIERRGQSLDEGLDRLREAVTAGPVETVCTAVMNRLIGFERPTDDVALLAVRRLDGAAAPLDILVPAVASTLGELRAATRRWLTQVGATAEDATDVLLAIGEATSNVVEHAYGPDGGLLRVRLELDPPDVVVTVRDWGRWRPPRGVNRGRGNSIMAAVGDEIVVDRQTDGTEVVIRRRLGGGGGPG